MRVNDYWRGWSANREASLPLPTLGQSLGQCRPQAFTAMEPLVWAVLGYVVHLLGTARLLTVWAVLGYVVHLLGTAQLLTVLLAKETLMLVETELD